MAHKQQFDFVKSVREMYPIHFQNKRVLEVGSLNINGTVRTLFDNCEYIGIDVGPGPGVDIVCGGHEYKDKKNSFDVVISCECFEHNPEWVKTFENMHKLCKKGGLVIMTCATTGRAEHGTTRTSPKDSPLTIGIGWEYYKNLEEKDFRENFDIEKMFAKSSFSTNFGPDRLNDLYFWGEK